jgi:hypothetical protein
MIYFVQAKSGGPIKIGHAVNVFQRLRELQVANPAPLHVIGVMDGDLEAEARVHATFANDRLRGEWFSESDALKAFITANGRSLTVKAKASHGFRAIIEAFPDRVVLVQQLRVLAPTEAKIADLAVNVWHHRNSIPAWAWRALVQAAEILGVQNVSLHRLAKAAEESLSWRASRRAKSKDAA